MKKITLSNGLDIFIKNSASPTVTVQVTIKTGSAYESNEERGYSHFVEHMLFEGTKNRTNFQIANEIEKIGGELNGATTTDRTFYYIKVPKKYAQIAVDILSDILINPLFGEKEFNKEKQIILSEIDMYHDDPKLYQWTLLEKNLFSSSLKYSTAGSKTSIKNCQRNDLINYFNNHYFAENIFVSVAGEVKDLNFNEFNKIKSGKSSLKIKEPELTENIDIIKKRNIQQSYLITGYKTVSRNDNDSIVFDIIHAILGRGASGKIFDEIRNKRGLGYGVYVFNELGKYSGAFGVAVTTKKENVDQVKKIIRNEISNLKDITKKDLDEAKEYLLGRIEMDSEDTKNLTEDISLWVSYSSVSNMKQYIQNLKKVTKKDIELVVKKYFKKHVTALISERR